MRAGSRDLQGLFQEEYGVNLRNYACFHIFLNYGGTHTMRSLQRSLKGYQKL